MPYAHATRAATATAVALLLTATGGATASADSGPDPAAAASSASPHRAAGVDLRISGRGFGHGRGMSQYGAQSRALAGQGADRILDFYYPGTGVGSARSQLRILLTTPYARGLVVRAQPRLAVRRVATGARWRLPQLAGVHRWRLRWTSASTTTLELLRGGDWQPAPRRRWRSIQGGAELVGGGPVELFGAGTATGYRGALRTYGGSPGDMAVVNRLRMDEYLFGVVPRESPTSWEPAALRAQAVAARTYAQYHRQRSRAAGIGYDLCDTTSCQVYGGRGDEVATTNRAVRATSGTIRTWHGDPIIAEFSSSNGGQTAGTAIPYQRFKRDRFDRYDGNPNRSWTSSVPGGRVANAWGLGRLVDVRQVRRDGHGAWGGRVTSLRLVGSERAVSVSGDDLRITLGLRSTYLRIRVV